MEKAKLMGPMVGTPSTPKRGFGLYSCGGIYCSYVKHNEGFHPMCMDVLDCTSLGYGKSSS
jgi:hypothetical protein